MRKIILLGIAATLITSMGVLLVSSQSKKIERRPTGTVFSDSLVVPVGLDSVYAAIKKTFNDGHDLGSSVANKFPKENKFHYFYIYGRGDPIFPDDAQLQLHSLDDKALRHYATMNLDSRTKDFYLYEPTGNYYWFSDYHFNGAPAKFRCNFILHLEAQGNSGTRVQALEYLPSIWVGKAFAIGHSGPGFYADIRYVQPTYVDRLDLLGLVKDASLQN